MPEVNVSATVQADAQMVEDIVGRHPRHVLGDTRPPSEIGGGHEVTLTADVGDGTLVSQVVAVDVGPIERQGAGSSWPISWQPVDHRVLVPSFEGRIEMRPRRWETELRLVGTYRAPLGPLGAVGDRLVHERVEASIAHFLEGMARRIDGEAGEAAWTSQHRRMEVGRPGAGTGRPRRHDLRPCRPA